MVDAVGELNAEREAQGEAPVSVAVGVHYGPALLGNIGDERRLEFATIGTTVNVANRLEELCRVLVTPIVVSDAAVQAAVSELPAGETLPGGFVERGVLAAPGLDTPIAVWTFAR